MLLLYRFSMLAFAPLPFSNWCSLHLVCLIHFTSTLPQHPGVHTTRNSITSITYIGFDSILLYCLASTICRDRFRLLSLLVLSQMFPSLFHSDCHPSHTKPSFLHICYLPNLPVPLPSNVTPPSSCQHLQTFP